MKDNMKPFRMVPHHLLEQAKKPHDREETGGSLPG